MQNPTFVEALEDRRLLSVTGASLLHTSAKGATWTLTTTQAGKVALTNVQKVIGKATFNHVSCTEVDGTSKTKNGTSTSKSYYGLDKAKNVVSYGNVNVSKFSIYTTTDTDYFTPAGINLPAVLVPKKIYTEHWTTNTTSVTNPGGSVSTSSQTVKYTIMLTSATLKSIKVPAGTFKCYLLTETTATTVSGQTTNSSFSFYDAPGVGIVKATIGTGKTAVITQLTKFKA